MSFTSVMKLKSDFFKENSLFWITNNSLANKNMFKYSSRDISKPGLSSVSIFSYWIVDINVKNSIWYSTRLSNTLIDRCLLRDRTIILIRICVSLYKRCMFHTRSRGFPVSSKT